MKQYRVLAPFKSIIHSSLFMQISILFVLTSGKSFTPVCFADVVYHISGRITDSDNMPLADVEITVFQQDDHQVLLQNVYTDQNGSYSGSFTIQATGIAVQYPQEYFVSQVYPQPFSATLHNTLTIEYSGVYPGEIPKVELFDLLGRRVDFSRKLPAGVYFYRLIFKHSEPSRPQKMTLLTSSSVNLLLKDISEQMEKISRINKDLPEKQISFEPTTIVLRIEKAGYSVHEQPVTLYDDRINVCDAALTERSTTLTPAQREAPIRELLENVVIDGEDFDDDNLVLLDYLNLRPEFKEAGISDDGTVWAIYQDDQTFLILNTAVPDTAG